MFLDNNVDPGSTIYFYFYFYNIYLHIIDIYMLKNHKIKCIIILSNTVTKYKTYSIHSPWEKERVKTHLQIIIVKWKFTC